MLDETVRRGHFLFLQTVLAISYVVHIVPLSNITCV